MQQKIIVAFGAVLSVASAAAAAGDAIKVPSTVPYADANGVAGNVKRECPINQQLSDYIIEYAQEHHVATESVPATDAQTPGRVLVIEITDAVSRGNPFIGHRKSTSVRGTLYQDGAKVAAFRGERDSMGGAFAGFKGSCSVLGRTVKALGSDIATWLAKPVDDAQLGDLE
ncbi:MAG: hypothetical protein ABIR62_01905 [Dokdonella sp.]|uniref:hypothetical protein n=1 Tax=Dokdonella sp. TaxID=2291710 RepID=UPI003265A2CE